MQNIGQNWIWIVLIIAFVAFHLFGHGRHRHGGSADGGHGHGGVDGFGGFGHDGHGHHGQDDRDQSPRDPGSQPVEAAIDPISGSAIPTAGAITSVYQGKAYYFASKENRDRFEAAPQDFAGKAQGVPMEHGENMDRRRHRHGGC